MLKKVVRKLMKQNMMRFGFIIAFNIHKTLKKLFKMQRELEND
jgi:hypothetical protein